MNEHSAHPVIDAEVVIRKYGLLSPLDWNEDCEEELLRQIYLWNKLVEIEKWYRKNFLMLTENNSELNILQYKIQYAKEIYSSFLSKNAHEIRRRGKSKNIDINLRALQLHNDLVALKKEENATRKKVRENFKDLIKNLEIERRAKVKAARQTSGLWWNNYNAVIKYYERSRRMIHRNGGELKPKLHDCTGRFSNQLQGGLTVSKLFEGTNFQIAVRALPEAAWTHPRRGERRRLQRTILTATVFVRDGQKRTVSWPMIMHRPIPDDCLIKEVVVTRKLFGESYMWEVVFTCTRIAKKLNAASHDVSRVAVDLGWRRTDEGLRVATTLSDSGSLKFFTIPNDILNRFYFADTLKEEIINLNKKLIDQLKYIDLSSESEKIKNLIKNIVDKKYSSIHEIKKLHIAVINGSNYSSNLSEMLEKWRIKSKRLIIWEFNQRAKAINRRTMLFQIYASEISSIGGIVILQRLNLSRIILRNNYSGVRQLHKNSARNRNIAALSILRHWIKSQCKKNGVPVLEFIGKPKQTCYACRSQAFHLDPETGNQVCLQCRACWDADVGACQAMLTNHAQIRCPP